MYYKILLPVYEAQGVISIFDLYLFPLFVLLTVIIAASGNVINDIVDIDIDKVNKPDKWIVGNSISPRNAFMFYYILIFVGGLLAYLIAYKIDKYYYLLLYVFAVIFLFLYSKYLKKLFLIGNILISVFSAGVIGIILIFEYETGLLLMDISVYHYDYISDVFFGFMFFSFFATMYRELVKDIEDVQGDKVGNAHTVPVVLGIEKSVYLTVMIVAILLVGLIYWSIMDINRDKIYFLFYEIVVIVPFLLWTMYLLLKAKKKEEFSNLSKMIKIFMLLGIIMLGFYFY